MQYRKQKSQPCTDSMNPHMIQYLSENQGNPWFSQTKDEAFAMQARIQKWGDTLAIRIPQSVADEIGIDQDSLVELTLVDERLMIAPVSQSPEETLESLLAQVTEENIHHEEDMGPPVGKEIW